MIERIFFDGLQLALILRSNYVADGIHFFTPDNYSQQLGYMKRPVGYVIPPHVHNPVRREVEYTKEVLFIRRGVVRIDFYTEAKDYFESVVVRAGDVVLLAYGGHGFEILEEAEIIEVKQGPYAGDLDKTRFESVEADKINIKEF
jgi:hypothetical protein